MIITLNNAVTHRTFRKPITFVKEAIISPKHPTASRWFIQFTTKTGKQKIPLKDVNSISNNNLK